MTRIPSNGEVFMLGVLMGIAIFETWWAFALMDRVGGLVGLLLGVKCWQAWKEVYGG